MKICSTSTVSRGFSSLGWAQTIEQACSLVGWITGHTYLSYGPLLCGATSVLYEGEIETQMSSLNFLPPLKRGNWQFHATMTGMSSTCHVNMTRSIKSPSLLPCRCPHLSYSVTLLGHSRAVQGDISPADSIYHLQ